MRSTAVIVPIASAEAARRRLAEAGILRNDLRVRRTSDSIAFPVSRVPEEGLADLGVGEADFEPRSAARRSWYGESLEVPEEIRAVLPRAFDVVGEIALVRLPPELGAFRTVIGEALLDFLPGVRLVVEDLGVEGPFRLRRLSRLAGEGEYRTVHRENGLAFRVDLERAYFSPRLAREHERVAAQARAGEPFWDLCAGVGPFGLTVARRRPEARVTLVDANPAAMELAAENARALGVADRVDLRGETLESFLPGRRLSGRVVLNLPLEGNKYLTQVADAVEPAGSLHYFEVMERSEAEARRREIPHQLLPAGEWTEVEGYVVHPYSPHADLWGLTLHRGTP